MDGARTVSRRTIGFGSSAILHVGAMTMAVIGTSRALPVARAARSAAPTVFVQPDATPRDRGHRGPEIENPDRASSIRLQGFEFDGRKVMARAGSLFPFVTGSVSLEMIAAEPRTTLGSGLLNRLVRAKDAFSTRPALGLSDTTLQALIDDSWSRRDRWSVFSPIRKTAEDYDADRGRLPALLRAYEQQNGLQPYVDAAVRDVRLWTELGLAADHQDFIDFISAYSVAHPSTKGRTELLFLLDKLAQGSHDALLTLIKTIPEEDLDWTRQHNAPAYHALVDIRRFYIIELQRRGLGTELALDTYYDAARLSILMTIIETTPADYRANDARLLIGEILWRQGRALEAARWWAQLRVDPDDSYAAASSRILGLIRDGRGRPLEPSAVNQVLNAKRGAWLAFSATRLRHFGYHFDTY